MVTRQICWQGLQILKYCIYLSLDILSYRVDSFLSLLQSLAYMFWCRDLS